MIACLLAATLAFAQGDDPAVRAYLDGDFAGAEAHGRAALQAGSLTGDVYYNLGNALYRQGELAPAILAWRRAQVLSPRDGDIRANLERARRETRDRTDPPGGDSVLFWRESLSPAEQAWGASLLFGLLGLMGLGRRLRPEAPWGIPAFLTGVPAVLLLTSTVVELQESPGAVVLADAVEVRSAGSGGVVLFELHAGAEVTLWERIGDQAQIALDDERRGWIPSAALGVVDPGGPFPAPSEASDGLPDGPDL